MRRFKKWVVLTMVVVFALTLAACKAGVPSYDLQIDPATGKGTANFTIRIPKNDVPEVGNNFDKEGEAGYIKSPEALLELFKKAVPSGFDATMKDEPKMVENEDGKEVDQGNFAYTLTFSFEGIEDYNNKIMKLVGQASWDGANANAKAAAEAAGSKYIEIKPATMTYEPSGDKQTVTFTEDLRVLDVISYWAYSILTNDTTGVWNDIYKETYKDYPVTFTNTVNLDLAKYTVKFGDDTQEYRHSSDPIVTLKATVDAVKDSAGSTDAAEKDNTNNDTPAVSSETSVPKTGENVYGMIALAAVAMLCLASIGFIGFKLKKVK